MNMAEVQSFRMRGMLGAETEYDKWISNHKQNEQTP
jgi:hypothetical protein